MQLNNTFAVPVAVFDFSEHLPVLRELFNDQRDKFDRSGGGFTTTLGKYNHLQDIDGVINLPKAQALRAAIERAAVELSTTMGYNTPAYTPRVKNFWLNEMQKSNSHHVHAHYGSHFSGCIYVEVPPNSPPIRFSSFRERFDYMALDVAQYTVYNSDAWDYAPVAGQLFLWESWLRHSVPATDHEGVRRSAALDVVMLPKI